VSRRESEIGKAAAPNADHNSVFRTGSAQLICAKVMKRAVEVWRVSSQFLR
jgi:hypothetical protein